jgi:D-tyrosyl-tRNA(Tyr) deacylase
VIYLRAVVQRVDFSEVIVDDTVTGKIDKGLTILLGVEEGDTEEDAKYIAEKCVNLRIFEDENEKLNLSLLDIGGGLLVISQFTLLGDCRKGRRPNFMAAAKPEKAAFLYDRFIEYCSQSGVNVQKGVFQAHMLVKIYNNGPVTVLLDSKRSF